MCRRMNDKYMGRYREVCRHKPHSLLHSLIIFLINSTTTTTTSTTSVGTSASVTASTDYVGTSIIPSVTQPIHLPDEVVTSATGDNEPTQDSIQPANARY